MLKKIRDMNLSAKFLGSIAIILLVLTLLDINYNSNKEKELTQKEMKRWAFLLAENIRVALGTLMEEDIMDSRFSMIENMENDMDTIRSLRLVRSEKTNELFKKANEEVLFPEIKARLLDLEGDLIKKGVHLSSIKSEIAGLNELLEKRKMLTLSDARELPVSNLEKQVLETGQPRFIFGGDYATVVIPYAIDREGCMAGNNCHLYAEEGDVLGAIGIEFSTVEVQRDIARNNMIMAGFWGMRFVIFLGVIAFLLIFLVTRNIYNMLNVFGKVAEGDFSARALVKGSDELGKMAVGFNNMAQSLENTKKELDKSLLEVFALYNIGKAVNSNLELEQTLLNLVKGLGKSEKLDKLMIMLIDEESSLLRVSSFSGFEAEEVDGLIREPGQGFYGAVVDEGQGRLVEDVKKYADFPLSDSLGPEVNSIIAMPFFRGDKVFGLICAFRNEPAYFDNSDFKLFDGMAEQLTLVLNNAKLVEETRIKAIRDEITGLYNRRYFNETIDLEIKKASRHERGLSLFMIDIDHFKHYNDTNGHPEGDKLLSELCDIICHTVRSIDISCRYGGEEFAVILPETTKEGALLIAKRVLSAINRHSFKHGESQPMGHVSVSIGLASFPADGDNVEGLIKCADDALYKAKQSGRDRIELA